MIPQLPNVLVITACTGFLLATPLAVAQESNDASNDTAAENSDLLPDIREDETPLKLRKRNFVVVPIPNVNPTLDAGLILAGAYFWPQTEQQQAAQPASATGVAIMETSNDSSAYGISQTSSWNEDRWRFEGLLGHVDLKLEVGLPGDDENVPPVGWALDGEFLQTTLLRKISGNWYAGILTRYYDMIQTFSVDVASSDFSLAIGTEAAGLGLKLEYDSRDMPFNSYSGRHLELEVLFNDKSLGSDDTYESYKAKYRSYHRLNPSVVLAWELQGCAISGKAPLWDACRINLRGFPVTEYLGESTASGQAEARWQFHPKWGAVAFAGIGKVTESFSGLLEDETVPSYGLGLRFMVLSDHRINVRFDYARSDDNDGVYLTVGESF